MKTVRTMGDLRRHLANVPDEVPVTFCEIMTYNEPLECGTLWIKGEEYVAFTAGEPLDVSATPGVE